MDYLCIGSNGFAQVGNPEFFEKNAVEMKFLLEYLQTNHPIPEEFLTICWYKEKWFRHDFGDYSEIVLIYKDRVLEDWEESDPDKFDRFWEWFNEIESVNLESEIITRNIAFTQIKRNRIKSTLMSEMEARKYIAELFKIVGTNSVLVVMPLGRVKRLYCPFWVICNVEVPPLEKGNEYRVEAVKMTLTLEDVFIIQGKAYFVWYFSIKT